MPEELDPADALRKLLAERERAKRSVYAAHMAREKAEEEAAHSEKFFRMQLEEAQKLAAENASLRRQLEETTDQLTRTENELEQERITTINQARRGKALKEILERTQRELNEAYGLYGSDGEEPSKPTDTGSDLDLDETIYGDPHGLSKPEPVCDACAMEGGHSTHSTDGMPFSHFGMTPGRAIVWVARAIWRHWQAVSFALAASFALMIVLLGLASYGVYVDVFRPLWTPWPDDTIKWAIGLLGVSVFTFLPLNSLLKRKKVAPGDEAALAPDLEKSEPETMPKPATDDDYLKVLKEIFGDDDVEGPKSGS